MSELCDEICAFVFAVSPFVGGALIGYWLFG